MSLIVIRSLWVGGATTGEPWYLYRYKGNDVGVTLIRYFLLIFANILHTLCSVDKVWVVNLNFFLSTPTTNNIPDPVTWMEP
ncbi:hypothetical protein BDV32DRAFT_126424 [Aspergillus pseudonomiae]|nr:hypothetical protein BDV32DRAFT_126424 [Aspergillus pseudonomiae]